MAVIEIEIRGTDRSGGSALASTRVAVRQVERSLDEAGQAGAQASQEIRQGARQAGTALDAAADSAEDLAEATDEASESGGSLSQAMESLGGRAGKAGEMLGKMGPVGMAAAAAVGAAFIAVGVAIKGVMAAANASMERTNALARSKAQLGLSEADAEKFGKIAGKIYADNFGESLEAAGKAARDTAMFITSMTDPAFEGLAKKLSAVSDMMEAETKEVARDVAQLIRTGMVQSADEGFDLIVAAVNRGIDANDDLLDTINEYSIQFKKVGIDGKTAFGLIEQMMKAGARDSDIAADAVKEFALRSISGSKDVIAAYQALGLSAEGMQSAIAKGGPTADKAFGQIIEALKKVTNPAERAALSVALFGTQSEDLGDALLAMDLGKARTAFDDIAGAADRATATMGGSAFNAIEGYRRQWEMFKADIGDKLVPTFEKIMDLFGRVGEALKPMYDKGLKEIADLWKDNQASIESFWEVAEPVLEVMGAILLGTVVYAIEKVVGWIIAIGKTWEALKDIFASTTGFIVNMIGNILHAAAMAFGWIPGLGPKLKEAEKDFAAFRDNVNNMLNQIKDKTVTVTIDRKVRGPALGPAFGFQGLATGTPAAPPGYAVVGEEGPELVKFKGGERVYDAATSAQMMAGTGRGGSNAGGAGGGSATIGVMVASSPGASDAVAEMFLEMIRRNKLNMYVGGVRVQASA